MKEKIGLLVDRRNGSEIRASGKKRYYLKIQDNRHMKRAFIVLHFSFVITLLSCSNNSSSINNETTEKSEKKAEPQEEIVTCVQILDRIQKKDTIPFQLFDKIFHYEYQNIKLDSSFSFYNGLLDTFPKNNTSLVIRCRNLQMKEPYVFFIQFDRSCNLLRFQVTEENGPLKEYCLWDKKIEDELQKGTLYFDRKPFLDFIKNNPRK